MVWSVANWLSVDAGSGHLISQAGWTDVVVLSRLGCTIASGHRAPAADQACILWLATAWAFPVPQGYSMRLTGPPSGSRVLEPCRPRCGCRHTLGLRAPAGQCRVHAAVQRQPALGYGSWQEHPGRQRTERPTCPAAGLRGASGCRWTTWAQTPGRTAWPQWPRPVPLQAEAPCTQAAVTPGQCSNDRPQRPAGCLHRHGHCGWGTPCWSPAHRTGTTCSCARGGRCTPQLAAHSRGAHAGSSNRASRAP